MYMIAIKLRELPDRESKGPVFLALFYFPHFLLAFSPFSLSLHHHPLFFVPPSHKADPLDSINANMQGAGHHVEVQGENNILSKSK